MPCHLNAVSIELYKIHCIGIFTIEHTYSHSEHSDSMIIVYLQIEDPLEGQYLPQSKRELV